MLKVPVELGAVDNAINRQNPHTGLSGNVAGASAGEITFSYSIRFRWLNPEDGGGIKAIVAEA